MAIPPPIVPAPTTATRSIVRAFVPSARSGILAAARSAKNAWRSARDSGVCTSSRNCARSKASPSANGLLTAAATAFTHRSGAGRALRHGRDRIARELEKGFRVRIVDDDVADAL